MILREIPLGILNIKAEIDQVEMELVELLLGEVNQRKEKMTD